MKKAFKVIKFFTLLLCFLFLTSCASFEHGFNTPKYKGLVLSVDGAGEKRLKQEKTYDPRINTYLRDHKRPDYLKVVSLYKVKFYYVKSNKVVTFKRSTLSNRSQVSTEYGIPEDTRKDFSQSDLKLMAETGDNLKQKTEISLENAPEEQKSTELLSQSIQQMTVTSNSPNQFLFVIGIQDYMEAPNVPYARDSAKLFTKLAQKKFGIPERNTILLTGWDASSGSIQGRLSTLLDRLKPNDTLFFFYSGHGVPGQNGQKSYILPKDAVVGAYENPDFQLRHLYQKINESGVGKTYAFIDACFSGQASPDQQIFEGVAPAGRTTSLNKSSIPGNMTVITAGKNDQFANSYEEKETRLFSYYLMKGLIQNKQGKNLVEYLTSNVLKQSRIKGPAYTQTPQLYGDASLTLGK